MTVGQIEITSKEVVAARIRRCEESIENLRWIFVKQILNTKRDRTLAGITEIQIVADLYIVLPVALDRAEHWIIRWIRIVQVGAGIALALDEFIDETHVVVDRESVV